jgi:hypothetical protein
MEPTEGVGDRSGGTLVDRKPVTSPIVITEMFAFRTRKQKKMTSEIGETDGEVQ